MQRIYAVAVLALFALPFSSATWGQAKPITSKPVTPEEQVMRTAHEEKKMTHEEEVVRTAYARLAFANQVGEIHKMLNEVRQGIGVKEIDRGDLQRRMQYGTLRFELGNFKVGPISEIAKVKYSDLTTKPTPEDGGSLFVYHGHFSAETDTSATNSPIAGAKWMQSPNIGEDWDIPFAAGYAKTELVGQHDRYATFNVHVTLEGRSRDYHVLFLFGVDKVTGKEIVFAGDMIIDINGGALTQFISEDVYPEALVDGGLGKDPAVHEWLDSGQVSGAGRKTRLSNCDPVTLKCGIHSDDLRKLNKKPTTMLRKTVHAPMLMNASFHPLPLPPTIHPAQQGGGNGCAVFTKIFNLPTNTYFDSTDHFFGGHTFSFARQTACEYTDAQNTNGKCNTVSRVDIVAASPQESGIPISGCHKGQTQVSAGVKTATGAGADSVGAAGGAVKSCFFCLCGVTIKIEKGPIAVTVTSDGFYTVKSDGASSCVEQIQPTQVAGGGGGGGEPDLPPCDPAPTVDGFQPVVDPNQPCMPSPIIIDTEGEGFQLTSAANGVTFDIRGNGHPIKLSWTARGSHNAFLALDRDGSGTITSGKELFGNFTKQPQSGEPNGFLALAEFDKPENGGNGDGVIDEHDAIFPQLRLWIDGNHDGVAEPYEIHSLSELGVYSLALNYHDSRRQDQYGNQFRYKARVNPHQHDRRDEASEVGRNAYDVFFVTR